MASFSRWRTPSWSAPKREFARCGLRGSLRECLELLAVRFDPIDLRLFLAIDVRQDLGPRDTQAIRMHGPALAFLLDVALVDPSATTQFLHRDADLGLAESGRLLDLHRRRLFALRQEDEGLGDVPRKVGLHEDASAYPRLLSFLQPA